MHVHSEMDYLVLLLHIEMLFTVRFLGSVVGTIVYMFYRSNAKFTQDSPERTVTRIDRDLHATALDAGARTCTGVSCAGLDSCVVHVRRTLSMRRLACNVAACAHAGILHDVHGESNSDGTASTLGARSWRGCCGLWLTLHECWRNTESGLTQTLTVASAVSR